MLKGVEEVGVCKQVDTYPQSWWCKLASSEQAASIDASQMHP